MKKKKKLAVERIRTNQQGFGNKYFKMYQLKECLTDYRISLMFYFVVIGEVPNGGISNFSAIMLTSFDFSTKAALRLNIGLCGTAFVFMILISSIYSFRILVSVFAILIALTGSSMLAFASKNNVAMAGLFVILVLDIGFIFLTVLFQSNVTGHTKKVVGNGIFLVGYCAGNIIGPQTFKSSEAPDYRTPKGCIVACYAATIVLIICLFFSYLLVNRRRYSERDALGNQYEKLENIQFADLTDRQNPAFSYSL